MVLDFCVQARKVSSSTKVFLTPRMAEPSAMAEGTFFVHKAKSWRSTKCSFKLLKGPAKDLGNRYYIEAVPDESKGNKVPKELQADFPLTLSDDDKITNSNHDRYEFELVTVAAGSYKFRFERKADFSDWMTAIGLAITMSKKRNAKGSLVEQMRAGFTGLMRGSL